MNNSLLFLYIFYFVSIFIHIISIVQTLAFVIPLQIKEAQVNNGLALLRKQLLTKEILSIAVSLIAILVLSARFIISGEFARYTIVSLVFIHAIAHWAMSFIDARIYRQQYTPDNKELHRIVEKLQNDCKEGKGGVDL